MHMYRSLVDVMFLCSQLKVEVMMLVMFMHSGLKVYVSMTTNLLTEGVEQASVKSS